LEKVEANRRHQLYGNTGFSLREEFRTLSGEDWLDVSQFAFRRRTGAQAD
jgi:hypothetical protein